MSVNSKINPPPVSELDAPIWAVVSFERCEAADITYDEAARKLAELDAAKVNGLCIVTSATAARLRPQAS